MSNENQCVSISNEELRIEAINEVSKNMNPLDNIESFVKKISKKFIDYKLYTFPGLCDETRRVNFLRRQEDEKLGNPGGWSEKRDFKIDYIIPTELYLFMTNLVYRNFWAEENEKVWRSFMKAIMRGDDPHELLGKVKLYYAGVETGSIKND